MVSSSLSLASSAYDVHSDLDDFRGQLIGPLTLVPALAAVYVLSFTFDSRRFETWLPIVAFAAVAALARWARRFGDTPASLCLTAGLLMALTGTVYVYPGTSVATLFAPVVAIAVVLLGPWFGLGGAAVTSLGILAIHGTWPGITADVAHTAVFLTWATAILSWLATRPAYAALAWAWYSYLDGLRKTEELRDRQGELGRLSKSLRETCVRLEHLNQELERARLAAEEARRLKDEFAATVSHELRTPLNLIIGFSEMMVLSPGESYDEPLPASYRGDVEAVYRNACHISNLIDDILDLSRIDAHRMALQKETVSLRAVVEGAVASIGSLFRDKKLRLVADLPSDLPPVHVDATRIRQILINLLTNAARFTDHGGATISASRRDHEVVIAVADTGVGLSPDEAPRAFEPFQQVGDRERRQAGRGLGLAISKRFVEMHGGSMWVESRPGEGTTFYFSLPLHGNVVVPVDTGRWEAWMAAQMAGKERTVLALDEDGEAARILQRYLDGYRVVTAPNLAQARRLAAEEPFQALVLTSPTALDGRTSLSLDQPHLPDIPTILCPLRTSWAGARELGVVDYLVKPVSSGQLRTALRRLGKKVRSVLVVDDDPDMVRLLARMIRSERRRCQTWEAQDGRTGLQLLRERRPDVLLLDLLMPEVDGYAMLEAMRADQALRDTPVIVITAKGREQEAVGASSICIRREGGFSVGEAMRCLRATLDALLMPTAAGSARVQPASLPE